MNAQVPHSIAEFVKESKQHVIHIRGLPPGVKLEDVERKFSQCTTLLQPLGWDQHYFFGWFKERKIRTLDDKIVFTLELPVARGRMICFPLVVEKEGLRILQSLT